jgi:hypothetical protein
MATKAGILRIAFGDRCKSLQFKALGTIENSRNHRTFWHKIRYEN